MQFEISALPTNLDIIDKFFFSMKNNILIHKKYI